MTPKTGTDAFWQWSLSFYGRSGAKDRLLALQDRYLVEVNTTLWCIWTAHRGWCLTDEQVREIVGAASLFAARGAEPIRSVRRFFSAKRPQIDDDDRAAFRKTLLAVELEAERLVQQALVHGTLSAAGPPSAPVPKAIANAAAKHFMAALEGLEKPVMFADERKSRAPLTLFGELLALIEVETQT